MKKSVLAQHEHIDNLIPWKNTSFLVVPVGASTAKELCAGMDVMSKFSLKVHVPAFRLQCFVHTALFKYIINKIGFISEGSDYLPPERAWKWTKTSKQNREVVIWTYTCMYPQAVMLGLMEDGIFPQITVN